MLFFKRICDVYDEEYLKALEQIGDAELTKGAMCHPFKFQNNVTGTMYSTIPKTIDQAPRLAY